MTTHTKYVILTLILVLGSGCSEPAHKKIFKRMTGEELGYWGEISGSILNQARSTHTGQFVINLDDESDKTTIVFPNDGRDWNSWSFALKDTLPPESLSTLHKHLQGFLQAKIDRDESTAKQRATDAVTFADAFLKEVSNRQPVTDNGSVTKFIYAPPLPIGQVTVDDSGRFRVETGDSINTPVGSFGATKATSKGVTRLIIRSEGKQRIFRVDRPFQVYVPADYGFDISGDGDRKLTIDVRKK